MRNFGNRVGIFLWLLTACTQRPNSDGPTRLREQASEPSKTPQTSDTTLIPKHDNVTLEWTYRENPDNIVSPGRGFYSWNTKDTDKGLALIRIVLASYCDGKTLDAAILDNLEQRFTELRQVPGKQAIIRVIYADDGVLNPCGLAEAAKPEIAVRHLQQLAPIFKAHRQDIAFFEAGFYGMWGEWNSEHAPNGKGYAEDPQLRFQIVRALLDELPDDFLVMIRRPRFRVELEDRLTVQEMKRLAFHNDCYLASETDMGTYDGDRSPEEWKDYIGKLSREGQAIGGETCVDNPVYTNCKAAIQDMERLGMTYLNTGWNAKVLQRWKDEGCFDEVASRLGYRFILASASLLQNGAKELQLQLKIRNDGFAPAYQIFVPELQVVHESGEVKTLKVLATENSDPRAWLPGETKNVSFKADASGLSAGSYTILLRWRYYDKTMRFPVLDIWDEQHQSYRLGSISVP